MKRILLPDLLKGLAAFFMVQIHITELFIDASGRESLIGKISLFLGGPFAAVVFMVVMGYFIAMNKSSATKNMLRGVKIFILGFLLNIGLNFHLLLKIKFEGWLNNPMEYIFGVDILYLAGMSIIVLAVLKSLEKGRQATSLILLVTVIALTGLMNNKLTVTDHYYILPFIAGNYQWSYFPLFPWLAYPLTGFIFAQYEEKIMIFFNRQKTVSAILLAMVALLIMLFYKQGIEITITLPEYYHHTAEYVLWALGITILWIFFLRFLLKLFPVTFTVNFFCWIGKNITLFYVIQWLIIGNIATTIYQTQPIKNYPYWLAGIFASTVLLIFLIQKARLMVRLKFRKPETLIVKKNESVS